MKSTLGALIAGVPARLEAAEAQDQQRLARRELKIAKNQTKVFQQRTQTALGSDVLASLGPVSYGDDSGSRAMRFQVNGRAFELHQTIGSVVNLLAGKRELF